MKNILIIIVFTCVTPKYTFGQVDSIGLIETAKLLIAAEKGTNTFDNWKIHLSEYAKVKYLQSKGFSKTIFLLMEYRMGNLKDIPDSLFKKNEVTYCCDYVVAFYAGVFYRLKGFVNNDFFHFLDELAKTSDEGFILKKNIFSAKKITAFNKLTSVKNIFIEDLDLSCLYQYYKSQLAVFSTNIPMSCIGSCTIKDRRRPYQNLK